MAQSPVLTLASSASSPQHPVNDGPLGRYGGSWHAELSFSVALRSLAGAAGRSYLADCRHKGPLRLQKALWPEGDQPVHLLMLHPPGGLAGGDQLRLDGHVGPGAQAFITTPGAGKFYKSDVPSAFVASWRVDQNAGLEFLPQETIVQDGAQATSRMHFDLHGSALVIAAEILVLGRKDSGEQFTRGEFRQHLSISRDTRLIFEDHNLWQPGHLKKKVVLGEHHVGALLWAARPVPWHEDEVAECEGLLDAQHALCGVSQVVPGLILVRVIGSDVEHVRATVHQAWAHLRPQVFQRQAQAPRIWNT